MLAIEYVKSVPRYLMTRYLGKRWNRLYTGPYACIRLADVEPPPLPGAGWVRLRPILTGICGSDIATITAQGSPYFSPLSSCPFVLGHEIVGLVEEVGPAVRSFRGGERVVLAPPLHCSIRGIKEPCAPCRSGRVTHCENVTRGEISAGIQTGYCRDTGGGWSSSLVAHEQQLHQVADTLPDEVAVMVEPFSCALSAVKAAPLKDSDTVIVLGCGTMGALTIAALRLSGFQGHIVAVAKHPHQQELAERLGASRIVRPGPTIYSEMSGILKAETFQPEIGRPILSGGAEICFDCVGSSLSLDQSLRFTRGGGSVILVGMPDIPRQIDWTSIWYKELRVMGSYTSAPATFAEALRMVTASLETFEGFVGARFPLKNFRGAVTCALNSGRFKVMKTVFEI